MIFITGKGRGEGPGTEQKASGFACMGSCLKYATASSLTYLLNL